VGITSNGKNLLPERFLRKCGYSRESKKQHETHMAQYRNFRKTRE